MKSGKTNFHCVNFSHVRKVKVEVHKRRLNADNICYELCYVEGSNMVHASLGDLWILYKLKKSLSLLKMFSLTISFLLLVTGKFYVFVQLIELWFSVEPSVIVFPLSSVPKLTGTSEGFLTLYSCLAFNSRKTLI